VMQAAEASNRRRPGSGGPWRNQPLCRGPMLWYKCPVCGA